MYTNNFRIQHLPHYSTNSIDFFITKNKNRLKIYNNNTIFLNDNDTFELELNNKSSDNYLIKILLNGKLISNIGIVIRAGEHIYLDTVDFEKNNKQKLKFSTYTIPNENKNYIKDNGLVEILCYKQKQTINIQPYSYPYDFICYDTINTSNIKSSSSTKNNLFSNNSTMYYTETGQIERSEKKSKQNFNSVNMKFESLCEFKISYKILPYSQKKYIFKNDNDLKIYCSNCGRRIRKNENFCPSCGKKNE